MSKMQWGPGMPSEQPNPVNEERHAIAVLVDNEPGVLARVVGLFSGRGYNIDSLTVTEVSHEASESRITIVTHGSPAIIEQIKSQLGLARTGACGYGFDHGGRSHRAGAGAGQGDRKGREAG